MAERRMMSKKITDIDAFLEMPLSSQALYFHFIQNADDDGFVGNPNSIVRKIGANKNDYDLLIAKRFVIVFPTGICVIKHWRIHNYIQNDRYTPTIYLEEKSQLEIEDNKSYTEKTCIQNGYEMYPQISIDKNSKDKISIDKGIEETRHVFQPPTLDEIKAYCLERNNSVNPNKFFNFYESKGWMVGKNKMKDWKAAVRTWENEEKPLKKEEEIPYAN